MKINFLGDIGIFNKFEELQIDPFEQIQLPSADFNIGNFEFIIPKEKHKFFYDVQEQYSCSYDYFQKLNLNKFHGFGLANNHCLDYGLKGALDTIEYIKKSGIQVFGFSQNSNYSIGNFEAQGIKIGIIACAKNSRCSKEKFDYGPDSYDVEKIRHTIINNRNNFNHIIIFPHWGTELIDVPNLEDTKNARIFIDAGASAVIGHHPHVSQGIEQYKNGLIAYSLGSFIYIHEEELGYSKRDKNRKFSICLQVEFSKNSIIGYQSYYYEYNPDTKIPEITHANSHESFAQYLDNNIFNQKLFNQEFRKILIRREIRSFWERLKSHPLLTLFNYTKYLGSRIIKKLS